MDDKKQSLIDSYRKELAEIHPSLPAYFYATNGYIIPWIQTPNGEQLINQFLLERVDPNGEVDAEVLDELIRIWISESWFGLAFHPPLAFMLLRRHLNNPNSKLSQLLYKDGIPKEVSLQEESGKDMEKVWQDILDVQAVDESKTTQKARRKRSV